MYWTDQGRISTTDGVEPVKQGDRFVFVDGHTYTCTDVGYPLLYAVSRRGNIGGFHYSRVRRPDDWKSTPEQGPEVNVINDLASHVGERALFTVRPDGITRVGASIRVGCQSATVTELLDMGASLTQQDRTLHLTVPGDVTDSGVTFGNRTLYGRDVRAYCSTAVVIGKAEPVGEFVNCRLGAYRCREHGNHMLMLLRSTTGEPVITRFLRDTGEITRFDLDSWKAVPNCRPVFDHDFGLSAVRYVHVAATPEQFDDCPRHES